MSRNLNRRVVAVHAPFRLMSSHRLRMRFSLFLQRANSIKNAQHALEYQSSLPVAKVAIKSNWCALKRDRRIAGQELTADHRCLLSAKDSPCAPAFECIWKQHGSITPSHERLTNSLKSPGGGDNRQGSSSLGGRGVGGTARQTNVCCTYTPLRSG